MKISTWLVALTILVALAGTTFAGERHKCDKGAEECLEMMVSKIKAKGWLGIETEKNDAGRYAVTAVTAGSPAEKAGFRTGDVLLALNGVELSKENKKKLAKVKKSLGPNVKAEYTVKRSGGKQNLTAWLTEVPETVMAQWIGEHMVDQHAYATVAAR